MCAHFATERETLEEKPFNLPTDSLVSALTLGLLIRFPVTKSYSMGVSENIGHRCLFDSFFFILILNVPF